MKQLFTLILIAIICIIIFTGCNTFQQTKPTTASATPDINLDYIVLKEWKINDSNSVGVDILINEDLNNLTKKELINFITAISIDKKYASVNIYSTPKAYQEANNNNYGTAYNNGFILSYVKDTTNSSKEKINEITWQQKKGTFSNLFKTKTKLD
ncbi:hypothetical protein [Sporohalobacter salinus]|uniref:hypothetical protein n=1 Tax=Sporohalobacter salinus TaxID=1494606 RepID=UPI001960B430|nr:hypothetical protein [Sporohalobacter salinus]MBM7625098.1 hypothetical protein [Sporohalobacter salinus]